MQRRRLVGFVSASLFAVAAVGGAWLAEGCGDASAPIPVDASADADADPGFGSGSTPPGSSGDGAVDAGSDADASRTSTAHGACGEDGACESGHCVELTPGGFHACSMPPEAPQTCESESDECCGTCDAGVCTLHRACGPVPFPPHNACIFDSCANDSDCGAKGICLPAALAGVRSCLTGNACKVHADCAAAPGGTCAPVGIIAPATTCAPFGSCDARSLGSLECIYDGECASDAECPGGGHCERVAGRPTCKDGVRSMCPPPP